MQRRTTKVSATLAVAAATACALGVQIDFDDGPAVPEPIGDFYARLGLAEVINGTWSDNFDGRPGTTSPYQLYAGPPLNTQMKADDPIVLLFDPPVSFVSISAIDVGSNDAQLDAYNTIAGGTLVGSSVFEGLSPLGNTFTPQDTGVLSVAAPSIRRVELYQPKSENEDDGTGFDNLEFTPVSCPADLNGSGTIESGDLNILLADFGCTGGCAADLDGDADTDSADLNILLARFGSPCPG